VIGKKKLEFRNFCLLTHVLKLIFFKSPLFISSAFVVANSFFYSRINWQVLLDSMIKYACIALGEAASSNLKK
jgi:hypothetical protein